MIFELNELIKSKLKNTSSSACQFEQTAQKQLSIVHDQLFSPPPSTNP